MKNKLQTLCGLLLLIQFFTTSITAQYTINDSNAFSSFVDISATGTPLGLSDDGETNIILPFDFEYFGTPYAAPIDIRVGNNGGILFNETIAGLNFTNDPLPTLEWVQGMMPWWDDFDTEQGDVFWEVQGAVPNRSFIVQWHLRPHWAGTVTAETATFQVVLFESSNVIAFNYEDTDLEGTANDDGLGGTIGLQDGTETLQYSFNTASLVGVNSIIYTPETNDLCANALPITCGATITGTTIGATTDVGDPFCGTGSTSPGVWYSWTGDGSEATFSTCNAATFDTKISVYSGACGGLSCIAGNDDTAGCGLTSEVNFTSIAGTDYLIHVHAFGGAIGDFDLSLTCTSTAPDNDLCADAEPITCGTTVAGTTTDATTTGESTDFCGTAISSEGVWYSWTGDGSVAIFSTCNAANYDTKINVYSGACGALVCETGNDDGTGCAGFTSEAIFTSTAGTDYLIYVQGFSGETGDFDLSLTCVPPPPNDLCAGALSIAPGVPVTGSTTFASTNDATGDCGTDANSAGVWYTWTGDGSFATFETCLNSSYDTRLAIYEGDCTTLTCVGENDDACGAQSSVGFVSTVGTNYFIYVTGFGSSTGDFELNLSVCPAPTAVCNPAITLSLDALGGATLSTAQVDNGSSVAACGGAMNLSISQSNFACVNIGTPTVVTLTVTDDNGTSATCDATITVVDEVAPVINCPANIVVDNDPQLCSATVAYTATATDNCTGAGTFGANLIQNGGAESGDLSGWNVTQSGGDGWVVRNNPGLSHSGNSCFASSYGWGRKVQVIDLMAAGYTETALDASPDIYVSEWYVAFFNTLDYYQLDVTLLDASMNPISALNTGVLNATPTWQQVEHIFSDYGPGVRYVSFRHSGVDSEFWAGYYGSMIDDAELRVESAASGLVIDASHPVNSFDVGTTTVTLSTMDDSGNPASCSFSVTVNDVEPADIICRQPISTVNTPGMCVNENVIMLDPFVQYDNCGAENVTITSDRPDDFEIGTTIVTWTVTDVNGNESTCQQAVHITDNEFPVVGPCNSIVQYTNPNSCSGTVVVNPEITDNCPGFTVTGLGMFNYAVGAHQHEIVVTDASGNVTVHILDVYIHEVELPEFTFCPEEVTLVSTDNNNVAYPANMMATATDNCSLAEINNDIPVDGLPVGESEVTFTAIDGYGNLVSCVVSVTVEGTSPIASHPLSTIESSLDENETSQVITWNPLNATTSCEYCEETNLEGFTYIGTWWGHQYFLADEVSLTREDAQLLAEGYDSHLAVINTADENIYLKEALSSEVRTAWIGLMPQEENGEWTFVWDNEEATTFTSLDLNMDEVTDATRIVLSQNGDWVAATDEEDKYFLIERPCVNFEQTAPIYQETEDSEGVLLRSGDDWAEGQYEVVYLATDMCGNETEMSFGVDVLPEVAEFCTTSGTDNSIWIEGVVFHELNNNSESNEGYADFTEDNILMNIGDGVVLVDLNAGGNDTEEVLYWRIWLDKNNDGDFFDANEMIFEQSSDLEHLQANVALELVSVENSRLRVAVARHAFPAPCGDPYVGEVEDYNVTLLLPEDYARDACEVQVAGLNAEKTGTTVDLDWVVNSVCPIIDYRVEYSNDGISFVEMQQIVETNNTDLVRNNSFSTELPARGYAYYRIKVQPENYPAFYTNEVSLNIAVDVSEVGVYPNPADEFVNINLHDFEGKEVTIQIFDNLAKLRSFEKTVVAGNTPVQIDLTNFVDGIYHITIQAEGRRTVTKRLVINKFYGWKATK